MSVSEWFGIGWSTEDPPYEEVEIDVGSLDADELPVSESPENRVLLEALRRVIDPEVGVNIVDLGLVYEVQRRGDVVDVVLTMTTPACPLSAVIEDDVRDVLEAIGAERVRIAVVFEPAWEPRMMSERARLVLGA